jgi:hypothetical protein
MVTATKKNASIALIVVAFATIMVAAPLALNIRSVYACGHFCGGCGGCGGCWDGCGGCGGCGGFDFGCGGCGGWGGFDGFGFAHHHTHQSIDQGCIQPTRSFGMGGFDHGFGIPENQHGGALSHNNVVTCVNLNFGGNAAVNDGFR